ncbi:MAG: DUF2066 domain-containing protein [Rhodanobacteraceae bacterium]
MMRILLSLLLALAVVGVAAAQTAANPASAGSMAPAVAAPAPGANPYSATVPVAGTSDAQRSAAIAAALSQVLQQVSPGFAATRDVLAQASGYVRDFHYLRAASGGLALQVDFDPGSIGRMVAQAQSGGAGTVAAGQPGTAASTGAGAAAQGGTGTLWVEGIDSSHAFASLLSTLRGDSALQDVTPVAAADDGVLLRLICDQPLATVLAGLTGPAGHLAQAVQPHPGADATLRWMP